MIKIITNNSSEIKKYLEPIFSTEKGLITVYIGWDLAKENGASILNKKIDENTYWTFLPTEKRKVFEEDLKFFIKTVIEKVKKRVLYHNISVFDFKTKEELLNFLSNNFSSFIGYLYKRRIYFYNDKNVYHLDLGFLDFMSWDIIDKLKEIIEIKSLEENKYLEVKYIPYLIDAKENNIISDFC